MAYGLPHTSSRQVLQSESQDIPESARANAFYRCRHGRRLRRTRGWLG